MRSRGYIVKHLFRLNSSAQSQVQPMDVFFIVEIKLNCQ